MQLKNLVDILNFYKPGLKVVKITPKSVDSQFKNMLDKEPGGADHKRLKDLLKNGSVK